MRLDILTTQQRELLSFIASFRRSFYLVGGTAIALYVGYRRSIDFDLFTFKKLNRSRIKQKVFELPYCKQIIFDDIDQVHFLINDVKTTFFYYPYPVEHCEMLSGVISMPSLLSLSAMKAFALGRRAKWKDYVDLYFILKECFSIKDISAGLAYALPVITALLSAKDDALLLIENPEAHLHPRGQSKLAELIALTAQAGVQVIIETHSDHIFNGIRKAVAFNKIKKENVSLYYFELDDANASAATEIMLSDKGRVLNFRKGLFDQFDDDLDALLGLQ